jgi:hypothetical protein
MHHSFYRDIFSLVLVFFYSVVIKSLYLSQHLRYNKQRVTLANILSINLVFIF